MRVPGAREAVDLLAVAGGLIILAASFGTQFRPEPSAALYGLGDGCSAWSRCFGEPIGGMPDVTKVIGWLCVAGVAGGIGPTAVRLLGASVSSQRAARIELAWSWALIVGMVAIVVVPFWQDRFVSVFESNRQFVVEPGWGLGGVVLGASMLVAAATTRTSTPCRQRKPCWVGATKA